MHAYKDNDLQDVQDFIFVICYVFIKPHFLLKFLKANIYR